MHLDKLQSASKKQDLCKIMKHGLMPSELVQLKFVVAKFCNGVPQSKLERELTRTKGSIPPMEYIQSKLT